MESDEDGNGNGGNTPGVPRAMEVRIPAGSDLTSATGEQPRADESPKPQFEVSQNFCTLCRVVQPLRTKHCRACDRCVATFDHHCKWLGNCVGEKNKPVFFVYVWFQLAQCFWCFTQVLSRYLSKHS